MHLITAQSIKFQNLTDNQGILPYHLGPTRLIKTYKNLVHIVDLKAFQINIANIGNTIKDFEKHGSSINTIGVTKLKMSELERKLKLLLPINRQKRGIINGIGTVIKVITGNMDANDAYEINRQIQNIQENNKNYNASLNSQTIFNHKLAERITNITDHINREQGKIGYFINLNANKIKDIEDTIQEQQYINHINYNIDLLTNHLNEISEMLIMAKLNIISKSILSHTELNEIFNIINKNAINITSEEHVYEILKLQAYYNSSNIIFNIRIPILSSEPYKLYHIIPLPINKTLEIDIKPYIIYNEQKIQYLSEICPKIEGVYLCEENLNQENTNESQCIGKILNNREAICPMNDVGIKYSIQLIENNNILLINSPITKIRSTCKNTPFETQGTLIISFRNCSVQINDILYDDTENEFWDQTYILPLVNLKINSNTTIEKLSLQKLKQISLKNEEVIIQTKTTNVHNQIVSYTTMGALAAAVAVTYFILKRRKTIINYIIKDDNIATPTFKSLRPSLYLRGGGVNSTTTPTST